MTTDPTEAALLAAVLREPAEDLHRLAYADWLDENGGAVPCGKCLGTGSHALNPYELANRYGTHRAGQILDAAKCETCGGSGRVPDGRRERAEFIRVQIANAKVEVGSNGWPLYGHGTDLNDFDCAACRPFFRELELFEQNRDAWFPVPPGHGLDWDIRLRAPEDDSRPAYVVRRGFVDEVRCDTRTLLGGVCGNCAGDGDVEHPSYENTRCPCPDCGGQWEPMDDWTDRGYSPGTGRTEGVAAAVFARHPVTSVELTDREPVELPGRSGAVARGWHWAVGDGRNSIPWDVYDLMPDNPFPSEATARAALSAGVVRVCRARAGLA